MLIVVFVHVIGKQKQKKKKSPLGDVGFFIMQPFGPCPATLILDVFSHVFRLMSPFYHPLWLAF